MGRLALPACIDDDTARLTSRWKDLTKTRRVEGEARQLRLASATAHIA
jgi:hypothetical protein